MKKFRINWFAGVLFSGLAASLTLAVNPVTEAANAYFAKLPADSNKIAETDFVAKVKANEPMLILDLRSPDAYNQGHVKGAVNVPWGPALAQSLDKLPKDRLVVLYCNTGQTAGQAVVLLNMAGFNAKTVNLGWNFGISKVDGVAEFTETEINDLPLACPPKVNPQLKIAIDRYLKVMDALKATTYANYKISEADAKALLDQADQNVIFLSVRKAEDYAKGHIAGAVNIPFGLGMQQEFDRLPRNKKIIVYCYTGQTAAQTVAVLRMLGFEAVSLNGGAGMPANAPQGWVNQGYPLVN